MDLVMMSSDEDELLAVQCLPYKECGFVTVAVGREVWGIYAVVFLFFNAFIHSNLGRLQLTCLYLSLP